ncbi:MAG: hypothetical protein ABIJ09_04865 [Pseudomonadota bacterium]
MEHIAGLGFRCCMYVLFGLTLEVIFAMHGIERMLGYTLQRRVPFRYLEGFTTAYMIPLHGLGILFGFELVHALIRDWFIGLRFVVWAVLISACEALYGLLLDKLLGFYPWDYYAQSRFKVFERGYTLWTLIPMWGLAGLMLEVFSDLMIHLTPKAVAFLLGA